MIWRIKPNGRDELHQRFTLRESLRLVWGKVLYWRGLCPACKSEASGDCAVCGGHYFDSSQRYREAIARELWYRRFRARLRIPNFGA